MVLKAFSTMKGTDAQNLVTTQSCTNFEDVPANSVDYIFTDPPFGSNIIYSDLTHFGSFGCKLARTRTKRQSFIDGNNMNLTRWLTTYGL